VDILSTGSSKDIAGLIVAVVCLDRHEGTPGLEFTFVVPRFFFWYAQTEEAPQESTGCRANRRGSENAGQDSPSDDWTDTRNQKRGRGTDEPPDNRAGGRASRGLVALVAVFGVALSGAPIGSHVFVVTAQYSNLILAKPGSLQIVNGGLRIATVREYSDDSCSI